VLSIFLTIKLETAQCKKTAAGAVAAQYFETRECMIGFDWTTDVKVTQTSLSHGRLYIQ